ncbi:MAG TPA: hypothetical protein RMH85_27885 [Polyangiaceae bacterium LLY-WYZ-15_(1-7)]|nr:hypothetical protein [Polyangiaceae bacterium LLY-WYZ-15_(1-7)]HJL12332.1 hypothetical protein [Polyangiaceae bacterium LLY-WYZ-15_(1-7)]HJL35895.1 hypothetical protein [Polyangiaceae bacterium LLY-WYZ-15_(1-7)]HJL47781.1 hypothetical protein [Polyangiaceae bacterium LLY-WYZ-15_(1-7)]
MSRAAVLAGRFDAREGAELRGRGLGDARPSRGAPGGSTTDARILRRMSLSAFRTARLARASAAAIVSLLLACGAAAPTYPTEVVATPAPTGGEEVAVHEVRVLPSDVSPGFRVIREADELVIVVSAGMGSGDSMRVVGARSVDGVLHVEVLHTLLGEGCPRLASEEWIGQVVTMARRDEPVTIHVTRRRDPPCDDRG